MGTVSGPAGCLCIFLIVGWQCQQCQRMAKDPSWFFLERRDGAYGKTCSYYVFMGWATQTRIPRYVCSRNFWLVEFQRFKMFIRTTFEVGYKVSVLFKRKYMNNHKYPCLIINTAWILYIYIHIQFAWFNSNDYPQVITIFMGGHVSFHIRVPRIHIPFHIHIPYTYITYPFHIHSIQLWPEIPVISTNKTPFIESIIPLK